MKTYPLHDTEYSITTETLNIELALSDDGVFGLRVYNTGIGKIRIEADKTPQFLQEINIGFLGTDAQDFIMAMRGLLSLLDAGD